MSAAPLASPASAADGDAPGYIAEWRVNGSVVPGETGA